MTQAQALRLLATGRSVFLTGEPGAGKTYVIQEYVRELRRHGIEPALTASTGIAATHIGGVTIHSWSGIGIKQRLHAKDLQELRDQARFRDRLALTRPLIIDEISMLDGRTLDAVDTVCRALRYNDLPFGGLQVVLVGDFFQLPPIAKVGESTPPFAFESEVWQRLNPTVCYLSEQHRQEDPAFLAILSALRRGVLTRDHVDQLKARALDLQAEMPDLSVPKLFPHNQNVDALNQAELLRLPGTPVVFSMTARGAPPLVESLMRGCLSPEQLVLKKGARVMFTKNSPDGRYVNGTVGEVVDFDTDLHQPVVQTKNGRVLTVEPVQWAVESDQGKVASITQIPLRLAWAMTIHKSQGMSMDTAYIDLSRAFVSGQGYVALSRVRSLSGLWLGGLNRQALLVDERVRVQDEVFRASSTYATEELETMSEVDLLQAQAAFLAACGRSSVEVKLTKKERKPKKERPKKYAATVELIKEGKRIHEVAKERERAVSTIITHLVEAKADGVISAEMWEELRGREDLTDEQIHALFDLHGPSSLKPIFEALEGRVSYDLLRIYQLWLS